MPATRSWPPAARTRRGAVLPFVLVLLTVLIGAAALAIDLGRLNVTATEVQGVADAAALGALSASQLDPAGAANSGPARAASLAARNRAGGQPGAVTTADVVPAWYSQSAGTTTPTGYSNPVNAVVVTARVRGTYALAGALGLSPPTVTRRATAWIGNMQGAGCVRPMSLPYTRIYEDFKQLTSKPYSSANPMQYAPTMTQTDVAQYAKLSPSGRTFALIPPWQVESEVDTSGGGHPNSGAWHTNDYTGGNVDWAAYQQYIAAPNSGPTCAAATASVGKYLYPFVWNMKDTAMILDRTRDGMLVLCHQYGGGDASSHVATCRNADGSVGVSTRVVFSDSIPDKSGTNFSQRIRMISQVRVMCYFVYTTDRCPAATISNGAGGSVSWSMPSVCKTSSWGWGCTWQTVDGGYPRGTMVVLLDGPVYGDLTPDVTLGDSLSLTQRLVLVK